MQGYSEIWNEQDGQKVVLNGYAQSQERVAELLRNLLPASDVPDKYIELFDDVAKDDSRGGKITAAGVARTLNASGLGADQQGRIMSIIAPAGGSGDSDLGRNEFNALLALIGLAQEGEPLSLDGVDERRRSESPRTVTRPGLISPYRDVLDALVKALGCQGRELHLVANAWVASN